MKKLCLLLILIINIFLLKAQNLQQTIYYADNLLNNGNIEQAIKEYQRALLFSDTNNFELYNKLAYCFSKTGDNVNASKYYDLAFYNSDNDSLKNSILLNKCYTFLLQNNFNLALIELYSMADTLPASLNFRRNLYLGIAMYGLNDFSESEKYFLKCIPDSFSEKAKQIKTLFNLAQKTYNKNPYHSAIFSIFIPGLGQFISGDYRNGINSIILVGSLWTLYSYILIKYSFLDAFLSIFPWIQRYYTGGFNDAYDAAIAKKEKKKEEIYIKILENIGL